MVMGGIGSTVMRTLILGDRMPFDTLEDIAPVSLVAKASQVLMVNSSLGVSSLEELVELSKTQRLTFGSAGAGSTAHLTGELFKLTADIDIVHVPYSGISEALNDLLFGNIDMIFSDTAIALPHRDNADITFILSASRERVAALPDLPTGAELGLPDLVMENWYGLFAPKETPAEVLEVITDAVDAALEKPELQERLAPMGLTLVGGPGEILHQQMLQEMELWAPIIAAADIQE